LSHGQQQWLEIALTLIQKPKLLLVDEPVAGMTREERNRTGEILKDIASHTSVLVVEHDMKFVEAFAARVTVLHEGKILCEGSFAEVSNDPRVLAVYLGRGE
jgi:urea transport system ATP-binding protein